MSSSRIELIDIAPLTVLTFPHVICRMRRGDEISRVAAFYGELYFNRGHAAYFISDDSGREDFYFDDSARTHAVLLNNVSCAVLTTCTHALYAFSLMYLDEISSRRFGII